MVTYRLSGWPRGWHTAAVVTAATLALAGCGKEKAAPAAPPPAAATPAATTPATPAPTAAAWTPEALDELLAPIALYPDALLGKILAASRDPQQVLDGGNWLIENQKLKGAALDQAAETAGFGPQMRSLFAFPDVVDMMCQNLDWTTQLGDAFGADQAAVLDSVQRLRTRAVNAGTFKSSPQQKVETQSVPAAGGGTKDVVVVEPADPQVVYVPKYDPAAVYQPAPTTVVNNYGTAPATTTTTTTSSSSNDALVGGLIGFGAGILVANIFHDDYYHPSWGYGYPPMPPPPMYRPPYGYGGGAYNRPPNYNSGNRYGNTNVNIKVDNSNYFKKFEGNANRPNAGGNRPGAGGTNRPNGVDRPGGSGPNLGPSAGTRPAGGAGSKVQGSYAGARPGGGGIPTTAPRVPGQLDAKPGAGPSDAARPGTREASARGPQGSYAGANQGRGGASAGTRDVARPAPDRGFGGGTGGASASARPANVPTSRPSTAQARPAPAQPQAQPRPMPSAAPQARPAPSGGGAFKSGGGGADRAAASRGRQSMGAGGGGGGGGGGRRGR